MAETLETGDFVEEARPLRTVQAPRRAVPYLARATPRFKGPAASLAEALAHRRLVVVLPVAMIGGIIADLALPADPQPLALALGALGIAAAALLLRGSVAATRLVVLIGAVWLGMCLLPIHGALSGTAMLGRPAYGTYQARVDEIVSEAAGQRRVILSAIAPVGASRVVPVRRARVLIKGGPDIAPGDTISGPFRFAPVPGPVLPGGFDTQFQSYFEGIGAYGNSVHPPQLVARGEGTSLPHMIDAVRRGIAMKIDAVLAEPAAGIARAIINGDQSAVADEARTVMATAGIAHVLSVSGLHLTIVAGGVFWILRLLLSAFTALGRYVSVKRVAAAAGMASALIYFAISGGNVAALRSTLMILLVFGAVLVGRRALTMRNVAIAALIVIATDPSSVFRPSFQLSFAAVVALVGAYENFRSDRVREASLLAHVWAYGRGIVMTSLIAGAATVLFSVYHFQQTSPLGVLGNLLTLPLVGFVMMPAALLAVLAMPFGAEAPFLITMGWSIDRMLEMARFVADWSTHLRAAPLLTPWALGFGLIALGWFAFFRDRWRLLGPAIAVPLVAVFALDRPPDVLVADTTQAIAIRGVAGLELAAGKPRSFALDVWRETYADPISARAAESCDSLACIGVGGAGFRYALVKDPAAFADECGRAQLIVARLSAPAWCSGGTVIDADMLAARGVHWLRWDEGSHTFTVRTAIGDLGRPWRVQ
ncbi:MAG TPA: ComEC/Rec2 family competence protein [Devosia sp.]|nr:ComEC/Rec2 family competence protein [Devosia sp.]